MQTVSRDLLKQLDVAHRACDSLLIAYDFFSILLTECQTGEIHESEFADMIGEELFDGWARRHDCAARARREIESGLVREAFACAISSPCVVGDQEAPSFHELALYQVEQFLISVDNALSDVLAIPPGLDPVGSIAGANAVLSSANENRHAYARVLDRSYYTLASLIQHCDPHGDDQAGFIPLDRTLKEYFIAKNLVATGRLAPDSRTPIRPDPSYMPKRSEVAAAVEALQACAKLKASNKPAGVKDAYRHIQEHGPSDDSYELPRSVTTFAQYVSRGKHALLRG